MAIHALLERKNDESAAILQLSRDLHHDADDGADIALCDVNGNVDSAPAAGVQRRKRKKASVFTVKRRAKVHSANASSSGPPSGKTPSAILLLKVGEAAGQLPDGAAAPSSRAAASEADRPLRRAAGSPFSFHPLSSAGTDEALLALLSPHNLLVRLLSFVLLKMRTVHSTCVLCEKALPFPGLNLSVCSSQLCTLSFEELGVGFDVTTAIANAPLLTDVCLSMLAASVRANHLAFAQPTNVGALDKKTSVYKSFVTDGVVDCAKLLATLQLIPPVDDLVALIRKGRDAFMEALNALDVLIVPLLRWLFTSCPTYVRALKEEERFPSIPTPYQVALTARPRRSVPSLGTSPYG